MRVRAQAPKDKDKRLFAKLAAFTYGTISETSPLEKFSLELQTGSGVKKRDFA